MKFVALFTLLAVVGVFEASSLAQTKPSMSCENQAISYRVGNAAIADSLSGQNQEEYCADLKVGERRRVSMDRSAWYAPPRYVLTRVSQNEYLIDLNLEFRPTLDYQGEYQDEIGALLSQFHLQPGRWDSPDTFYSQIRQLQKSDQHQAREVLNRFDQYYRKKIRQCITLYQDLDLLVDGDGRRFQIRLNDGPANDSHQTGLAQKPIFISNAGARNMSELYGGNLTCDVVVHELFHLVGLIDEYSDGACRAKSPGASLMTEEWNRPTVSMYAAGYEFSQLLCSCAQTPCSLPYANAREAARAFSSGSVNSCPAGFHKMGQSERRFLWRPVPGLGYQYDNLLIPIQIQPSTVHQPKSQTGVFLAGHGDQIIYPGCSAKNKKYVECGGFAYQKECANVPSYCASGDWIRK